MIFVATSIAVVFTMLGLGLAPLLRKRDACFGCAKADCCAKGAPEDR